MNDSPVREFDFHRNGHSARRDRGTEPRNLLIGFNAAMRVIEYHPAGDRYIRSRPVTGALDDSDFIARFMPSHAARIGVACERTRQTDVGEKMRRIKRAAAAE